MPEAAGIPRLPESDAITPRPLVRLFDRLVREEVLIAGDPEKADAIAYLRDYPEGQDGDDPLYRLAEELLASAPENFWRF
jgi:hypothetical protein